MARWDDSFHDGTILVGKTKGGGRVYYTAEGVKRKKEQAADALQRARKKGREKAKTRESKK